MNTLNNLTIMVTRPHPQGIVLCEYLEQHGAKVIDFPTIEFAPPQDPAAFRHAIEKLGEQDWLVFISPQAVFVSIPAIRATWPIFPPQVKFAAVGSGTAKALHQAGYIAIYPAEEYGAEGLLQLPEFHRVTGQKIAIIRGEGGRDLLDKTLTARGAQLIHVIAYQRRLPTVDVTSYAEIIKQKAVDVIICSSGEGVQNLNRLFKAVEYDLHQIRLLVVSERIKMLAQDLGFQTIWVAQNAKHETLSQALAERRNEIWQMK